MTITLGSITNRCSEKEHALLSVVKYNNRVRCVPRWLANPRLGPVSKVPETFRACETIFIQSVSENRKVYTSVHIS